VAWDGARHAFVLDTVVAGRMRRHGVGTGLVAVAVRQARAADCQWLHVPICRATTTRRAWMITRAPWPARPADLVIVGQFYVSYLG